MVEFSLEGRLDKLFGLLKPLKFMLLPAGIAPLPDWLAAPAPMKIGLGLLPWLTVMLW